MEKVLAVINWVVASGPNALAALVAVLSALVAFFLIIPGDQPEKALQKAVDFLSKFSKK